MRKCSHFFFRVYYDAVLLDELKKIIYMNNEVSLNSYVLCTQLILFFEVNIDLLFKKKKPIVKDRSEPKEIYILFWVIRE